jgi:exosortase
MGIQTPPTPTPGFAPDLGIGTAPASAAQTRLAVAYAPLALTAIAFAILFAKPLTTLARDWWTLPEAGHGLLLAPVAIWLAWRSGVSPQAKANPKLGLGILVIAVLVRSASGLAAELFTMRASVIVALVGLTVFHFGVRQVLRWWLPFTLACLSIPLPELVTQAVALPLQFKASRMGAALLEMRGVPVRLMGNVIQLPGRQLFVTEACSGLRSIMALLSMAVLLSALVLKSPISRVLLVALAFPVAIFINGIRVFLTGFLVFFVNPALGEGFMHETEGWLLFLVSLAVLAASTWAMSFIERPFTRKTAPEVA